jgi:hypothetical protein
VDVTAPRGTAVKQALPQQKTAEPYPRERLELVQLASVLAEQVERRQQAQRADSDIRVITAPTIVPARSRLRRRVAVCAMFAGAAVAVVMLSVSLLTTRPAPAAVLAPRPHPVAAVPSSQAGQLGQAAGQRLRQAGGPVDVFVCQGAYTADAASAPDLLPPATTRSTAQDDYIAGCMSDMSHP